MNRELFIVDLWRYGDCNAWKYLTSQSVSFPDECGYGEGDGTAKGDRARSRELLLHGKICSSSRSMRLKRRLCLSITSVTTAGEGGIGNCDANDAEARAGVFAALTSDDSSS